jgi:dephospho-CoA kinase
MLIGICGKSGSGKSTISNYLKEELGAIHCDIDKIGHYVLTLPNVQKDLINSFGTEIYEDEKINRKKLGQIVFNSADKMKTLEQITWKNMEIEIDKVINQNKEKIIILDWQLLSKTKYLSLCDLKILIDIPYEIRKQRLLKRDNISEEKIDLREKESITYNKNDFDYVFYTNDNKNIKRLVKL